MTPIECPALRFLAINIRSIASVLAAIMPYPKSVGAIITPSFFKTSKALKASRLASGSSPGRGVTRSEALLVILSMERTVVRLVDTSGCELMIITNSRVVGGNADVSMKFIVKRL